MNKETEVKIQLLECFGWFIAESNLTLYFVETATERNVKYMECCDPSGEYVHRVPMDAACLSVVNEEYGLEEHIWHYAPNVSTSMDDLEKLLGDAPVDYALDREVIYEGTILYDATVYVLKYDEEEDGYVNASIGYSYNLPIAALAVAEAYLEALEKLEETKLEEHD